jgi:DNA-binding response OmpR family regulator
MRRKPLVLIVDEDPYLAGIYGRRLEMEKCQVRVAESITEAKKKLAKTVPDAIMVDVAVEGEQGFALVHELRHDPKTAVVPLIVITALGDRKSVERGLASGADSYLIKGHFVPTEAAKKVVRLIAEHRK